MNTFLKSRKLNQVMILIFMLSSLMSVYSQAAMVSTTELIHSEGVSYSKQDLQAALASEDLKQQLEDLGVDASELNDRIASLTAEEVQQLNAELADQPAGAGVIGILLTVLLIFLITDMLCATNIYNFVNCIN